MDPGRKLRVAPPSPPCPERPVPPPAAPPFRLTHSRLCLSCAGFALKREEGPNRPESVGCASGLLYRHVLEEAAPGTWPASPHGRDVLAAEVAGDSRSWGRGVVRGSFSADAGPGDSSRAAGVASESAARGAAARCEAARRSCCKIPAAGPPRAASGLARDTPDSNTAPSNRADIASSFASQKKWETPRKTGGIVRRGV